MYFYKIGRKRRSLDDNKLEMNDYFDEDQMDIEPIFEFNILGKISHAIGNINSKQECQAALGCR